MDSASEKLTTIKNTRRENITHHEKPLSYRRNRGLKNRLIEEEIDSEYTRTVPLAGYEYTLPEYNGLNIEQIIEERVKSGQKVDILDIGCGEGTYLAECKKQWGDMIGRCEGITATDAKTYPWQPKLPDGITIQVGDAQRLSKYFKPENFDVITASRVFEYFSDPWSALKQMYDLLKSGGVCMIDYLPFETIEGPQEDRYKLIGYLEDRYGFAIQKSKIFTLYDMGRENFHDIAFKRTKRDRLKLPLQYTGKTIVEPTLALKHGYKGPEGIERLTYKVTI